MAIPLAMVAQHTYRFLHQRCSQDDYWNMHCKILNLLYTIANTRFGLDLGEKVTQNVAQYPLHNVTQAKFEVGSLNGLESICDYKKIIEWYSAGLEIEGLRVRVSTEALRCVLEQDTLSSA